MRRVWLIAAATVALVGCGQQDKEPREPKEPQARAETSAKSGETPVRGSADPQVARTSVFTSLGKDGCKVMQQDKETGDTTSTCAGIGAYRLDIASGDLRDDLILIHGKKQTAMGIPTLVANGAFDAIGGTAEWRGPAGGPPDILTVRVRVARVDGSDDTGSLVLIALKDQPCVVAVVPPIAGQSDKARAIADGRLPACLKS